VFFLQVLLFAGGLMHGSGANSTRYGRKSLLSSFQLGWLRPEYKFWAHKELHQVLPHSTRPSTTRSSSTTSSRPRYSSTSLV
jgi:ectoine hydroxylase-related dioxygenase (phytanoyl-CoA dioxygenase family)